MNKIYIFPLQVFIILEKANSRIWINQSLNFNNYYFFSSKKWFLALIQIFKNEVFLGNNILVEHSIIDMTQKNKKWLKYFLRFQIFYNFYFYTIKVRLVLFLLLSKNTKKSLKVPSIDKYFLNANWLERESSEMYGLFFFFKKDARKLLLDYSKIETPLLKDFPSEGFYDVFYNFFTNQVITLKNEYIEL